MGEPHNKDQSMNDHDLLIRLETLMGGMVEKVERFFHLVDQKADKIEVAALSEQMRGHERRLDKIEDQHREIAIRKNEKERISEWGWKVWAKIIGAISVLMMVWQWFQNMDPQNKQPINVQVVVPTSTLK